MLVRTAFLLVVLASSAEAAPFDDLKADLSTCLRFEVGSVGAQRGLPVSAKAGMAVQRCTAEMDRLERADPRRLRGDHGFSPSARAVIENVFGRGSRGHYTGLAY